MVFYEVIGWLVFWASLIGAIVLFATYKKIYPVFYLVSIALYIFTAGYMIEVFAFGRFGILTTLVISAVIFMVLGRYLSKILPSVPSKTK
jgi:hypothetical protein